MTQHRPKSGSDETGRPTAYLLVPFHDAPAELAACLQSIESQEEPVVAVLVDDGSGEPAASIARDWCEGHANRHLLRTTKRVGPAGARAEGLSFVLNVASDDDVVILLDGDDRLAGPESVTYIVRLFGNRPQVRMSLGSFAESGSGAVVHSDYADWVLDLRAARYDRWRAAHPRCFRVGLYREAADDLRIRWPWGSLLQGATDVALILPMLNRCSAREVAQPDEVLYVYTRNRTDGGNIHTDPWRKRVQSLGAWYVRRTVLYPLIHHYARWPRIAKRGLTVATEAVGPAIAAWVQQRTRPTDPARNRGASGGTRNVSTPDKDQAGGE